MSSPGIPDLTSILATLSQHSGHPAGQSTSHQPRPQPQSQPGVAVHQGFQTLSLQPQNTSPRANPVDPSRITTWPAALRYTTSLLASNGAISARIKKLIRSQHEHERTWWTGRQTVLLEREKRKQGRQAVNDVLRSLGGRIVDEEAGRGEGDGKVLSDEDVYSEYDGKVYRAAVDMVADVRRQLKEMGIPPFVIRAEMIGEGHGRISREEVMKLEARVLVLLEDLCKD